MDTTSMESVKIASPLEENDMEQIFRQHQTYARHLRKSTAEQRIRKLKLLKAQLKKAQAEIYQACHADFGKPEAEVDLTELFPVYTEINDAVKHLKRWMKQKRVSTPLSLLGTSSFIQYEPKGTSLLISPWNYPINLTFCPLISALAAGCTVIVKPSEMTPNISRIINKIIKETFLVDEVTVIEGGVEVSTALLNLPFDHIFFTGAPQIGKIVMAAAAKNLTSVTLELGGKSPVIVDQTADIAKAASSIMWGKFTNAGQTCIAPDYLYIHENVKEKFIQACQKVLIKFYGKDEHAKKNSADLCRIVNNNHFGRLTSLLDDAIKQGANVIVGGDAEKESRYIAPTLLENPSAESRIMQEEIFGPLLPILTYNDIDKVIDAINDKPKPLAFYIFSNDHKQTDYILQNTTAGGTTVNGTVLHFSNAHLPFGGVNNSGLGSSHGLFGFKAFSHERAVLKNNFSRIHMMFPPYSGATKRTIKMAIKIFG